jgi:hypothetical protein
VIRSPDRLDESPAHKTGRWPGRQPEHRCIGPWLVRRPSHTVPAYRRLRWMLADTHARYVTVPSEVSLRRGWRGGQMIARPLDSN